MLLNMDSIKFLPLCNWIMFRTNIWVMLNYKAFTMRQYRRQIRPLIKSIIYSIVQEITLYFRKPLAYGNLTLKIQVSSMSQFKDSSSFIFYSFKPYFTLFCFRSFQCLHLETCVVSPIIIPSHRPRYDVKKNRLEKWKKRSSKFIFLKSTYALQN
jgi:hypothetical protein